MNKRILFLTTAHHYSDDRIFYHQALSLQKAGNNVKIVSLSSTFSGIIQDIEIESTNIITTHSVSEKIAECILRIESFNPNIIICSEPLPVFAAKKYKKNHSVKIIYDITESYPSKKQLHNLAGISKAIKILTLLIYNIGAGFKTDGFIFGEPSKKFPFNILFPHKKSLLLPYFPDSKYIHFTEKECNKEEITLCYSGKISREKGIENFFNGISAFITKNNNIAVSVKIIGKCATTQDQEFFDKLRKKNSSILLTVEQPKDFETYTKSLSDVDICFDLRYIDFENNHCLPIKLFYYMACGKPFIYSNLKSIRNFVETKDCGYLVNPLNSDEIAACIESYCNTHFLYANHSKQGRLLYLEKYNWAKIEFPFISFIHSL